MVTDHEMRMEALRLSEENDKLRAALRRFALRRHVRMASGGGEVPSGGSCALCNTEWRRDQPEAHRANCLLANSAALASQRGTGCQ